MNERMWEPQEFRDILDYDDVHGVLLDTRTNRALRPDSHGRVIVDGHQYSGRRICWMLAYNEDAPYRLRMLDGNPLNLRLENISQWSSFPGGLNYREWYEAEAETLTERLHKGLADARKNGTIRRKSMPRTKLSKIDTSNFNALELMAFEIVERAIQRTSMIITSVANPFG